MISCREIDAERLPDITMYAGDTTPWNIKIVKPDGNPYPGADLDGYSVTLTFIPYTVTNGTTCYARTASPVLSKTGELLVGTNGTATIQFCFASGDTDRLRGKYVYQIEITYLDQKRVCQGALTIRHNINV